MSEYLKVEKKSGATKRYFEPEGTVITRKPFMQGTRERSFASGLRISGERFGITDRTIGGLIRRHELLGRRF
jgi:hypothetical protein